MKKERLLPKSPFVGREKREPRSKRRYEPIGPKVALQLIEHEAITEGGIELPLGSVEKVHMPSAWVISVGPECKQVKLGDKVLVLPQTAVRKCPYMGEELLIIKEEEISAIVYREDGTKFSDRPALKETFRTDEEEIE
jgi:co-chaperonin GroES (HSP10)